MNVPGLRCEAAPDGWRLRAAIAIALLILGVASSPLSANSEPAKVNASLAGPGSADWLPKVNLIDQNGSPRTLASLKGKPVLLSFIHTSCQGPCEMLTAEMKSVAKALGPKFTSKVTMVSITTDPKHDRPGQLLAYAKAQGVGGDGWVFLTGRPDQIQRLLALYGVPADEDEDPTAHVMELFLLGPNGARLRHYDGDAIAPAEIATDIRAGAAPR